MPAEKRDAFAPQLAKVALDFHALLSEPAEIEDVQDIDMPTLLCRAAAPRCRRAACCKRLRDALPAAQFRLVQGAGHMLPVTHRDEVNASSSASSTCIRLHRGRATPPRIPAAAA